VSRDQILAALTRALVARRAALHRLDASAQVDVLLGPTDQVASFDAASRELAAAEADVRAAQRALARLILDSHDAQNKTPITGQGDRGPQPR